MPRPQQKKSAILEEGQPMPLLVQHHVCFCKVHVVRSVWLLQSYLPSRVASFLSDQLKPELGHFQDVEKGRWEMGLCAVRIQNLAWNWDSGHPLS